MVEVTTLDLVIIGLYLLFMLLVGVWFVKRIKNTDDYYVAGRTLGPVVLAATVCATIIGGSAMMGRAGIAYTTGFMAIATALPYMLGMFIFSGYAGRIQQVGEKYHIESIPSLFEYRFGKPAKCVLAAMVAFAMVGTVAAQVAATATIIKLLWASATRCGLLSPPPSSSSIPPPPDCSAWCTPMWCSFSCSLSLST